MRMETFSKLLVGALAAGLWLPSAQAKTCLLLYQMADNNLEYYLRQDYEELTKSTVINDPNLSVYTYYDALEGGPLPGLLNSNGGAETGNFQGSRYIHYDQSKGAMVIQNQLNGEQNSDLGSTVQAFLEYGMAGCVASGHTSFMAVFSSHGGGFAGYGGDEHPSRRSLLQTNGSIVNAIKSALANTNGAPSKLSVIGFDACLMQAFGAADDYYTVADYILGSEAVEPGHGWAYTYLTDATDALTLATQVVDTFIDQTQGGSNHQTPKTLAIVESNGYANFVQKLEAFATELLGVIQGGDTAVHAYLGRARSNAVAFEGIVDAVGTKFPSAVDIGSVLTQFKEMCNPGGTLGSYLDETRAAYDAMYVTARMGQGTAPGTGMAITWPIQDDYRSNGVWQQVLFGADEYKTAIAPQWRAFLEWFLTNPTPGGVGGTTICGKGIETPVVAATKALLYEATVDIQEQFVRVSAEMDPAVDQVVVEYAVDLSTPLKETMTEMGFPPYDEDYLMLLGGDLKGTYDGSAYSTQWNRDFYFLDVFGRGTYEALYVFDQGNGAKSIPVLYFSEASRPAVVDRKEIGWLEYLQYNESHFRELGAAYGFLTFSVNGESGVVDNNLILFTSDSANNVFAEKRRADLGFIYPMVYVDGVGQGHKLTTLPGGFNQTHIDWDDSLDYKVIATPATEIFEVIPSTDAVVLNMYGFDFEENAPIPSEPHYFDIIRPNKGTKFEGINGAGGAGAGVDNGAAAESGVVSSFGLVGAAVVAVASFLVFLL